MSSICTKKIFLFNERFKNNFIGHQNNYEENLNVMNNAAKNFDILATL